MERVEEILKLSRLPVSLESLIGEEADSCMRSIKGLVGIYQGLSC